MIWLGGVSVVISCHFPMIRDASYIMTAFAITIGRVVYPASISWMILASYAGYGGAFAKFLNHPVFVHINKLTYAIYLIHPVIIVMLFGWQSHSKHIHPISMVCRSKIMIYRIKQCIYNLKIIYINHNYFQLLLLRLQIRLGPTSLSIWWQLCFHSCAKYHA